MSFRDVYLALYEQIKNDTTLLEYMSENDFVKGFRESLPIRRYMAILEPGPEIDTIGSQDYGKVKEVEYEIQIFCRLLLQSTKITSTIVGNDDYKGLLDFTSDVKYAIRREWSLSYNTVGQSRSKVNAAATFNLSVSHRYIAVSIDGRSPSGYNVINCGTGTLAGAVVAANIQQALRFLGKVANDGYKMATCSFDSDNKQFTIRSSNYGPRSSVIVNAGASADASGVLGFDTPTETRGTKIIKLRFGNVSVENGVFPVRYRVIPVLITEEVIIGGMSYGT